MRIRYLTVWVGALALAIGAHSASAAPKRPEPHPEPIMESDQPDAKDKAKYLPVLEDGPGKGYYLYYERRTFDAAVDQTGALLIRLKDDKGKLIGKDWMTVHRGINTSWQKLVGYNSRDKGIYKSFVRYMEVLEDVPRPSATPRGMVALRVQLMDNVKFVRRYEFDGDRIAVHTGYDCRNAGYGSDYGSGMTFGAVAKFEPQVPQTEREAKLKGYEVALAGVRGRDRQVIPYAESQDFMGSAQSMAIVGPWGPRKLTMEVKDAGLRPRKYKGRCPYEGFSVSYDVGNKTDSFGDNVEWSIRIE